MLSHAVARSAVCEDFRETCDVLAKVGLRTSTGHVSLLCRSIYGRHSRRALIVKLAGLESRVARKREEALTHPTQQLHKSAWHCRFPTMAGERFLVWKQDVEGRHCRLDWACSGLSSGLEWVG